MSEIKRFIIFGLILLPLALNCLAMPVQLSGNNGRDILDAFANNSTNRTSSTSANESDLWNWGKLPVGHFINSSSGKLAGIPIEDDSTIAITP